MICKKVVCMQNPIFTTIPEAIIYDLIIDIMMTGFNQYQKVLHKCWMKYQI